MDARSTWGSNTSTQGRTTATSRMPKPSSERMAVPALPLSVIWHSTAWLAAGSSGQSYLRNTSPAKQLSFLDSRRSTRSASSSRTPSAAHFSRSLITPSFSNPWGCSSSRSAQSGRASSSISDGNTPSW